MRRQSRRKWLFGLSVLMVVGSVTASAVYAWRLHSGAYRRALAEQVSDWLGMEVSFARFEPLSIVSRAFGDVRVRMVPGGPDVFHCRRAVWNDAPDPTRGGATLSLADGFVVLGDAAWGRGEYQRMLEAGLRHDFAAIDLASIRLSDFDLRWQHPGFAMHAQQASGQIRFDADGQGEATLTCRVLNGQAVRTPVRIGARFTPDPVFEMHRLELDVPTLDLARLKLDELLGGAVRTGRIAGRIVYERDDAGDRASFSGFLHEAALDELTRRMPGGPYDGSADVTIDRISVSDGGVTDLQFRGALRGIRLGQVWPALDPALKGGHVDIEVDDARYEAGRVAYLSLTGRIDGVSLERLSRLWDKGTVTGSADLAIHSLIVRDDRLRWADVEVVVTPPADGPGIIDRRTLAEAGKRLLGVDVAFMLPERVAYERFGARFKLDGDQLRVLGTHGTDLRTILTVDLFGRPVGIIRQPDRTFTVPDVLAFLKEQSRRIDRDRLSEWWDRDRFGEPEAPAAPPANANRTDTPSLRNDGDEPVVRPMTGRDDRP